LKYENVNASQPFPFEPASFDVVHIRLVLMHLPHFPEVLNRIIQLVKPGGFLLAEDGEHNLFGKLGPGITKFYEVYHSYMRGRGVDEMVGPKLEPLLKESGVFREVHATKIEAPFSGKADDPKLGILGTVIKLSFCRAYKVLDPKLAVYGTTQEVQEGWYSEIEEPSRNIHAEAYLTWAQRHE